MASRPAGPANGRSAKRFHGLLDGQSAGRCDEWCRLTLGGLQLSSGLPV